MTSSIACRTASLFAWLFWATTLTLPDCAAQTPVTPPTDARTADRTEIRGVMDSLSKSFEARDANLLASHWSAEGEYKNGAGLSLRGRDSLVQAFNKFFAKTPEVKAEIRSESLRFVGLDSAIDEGLVTMQRGPVEPAAQARYNAIMVREDGKWRIAMLQESDKGPDTVEALAWLIGEWQSKPADGVEIHTTYSWLPSKKFIQVQFSVQESALALNGTQIIGVDPETGTIRSWTFESSGGVGETDWSRDGDHWVLEAIGTLNDGRTLMETNILRRIDQDTFTFQSIHRLLDDIEVPDLAPVKVTRVKTAK